MDLRLTKHVRAALKPRTTLEAQNAWNLYGDIAWFGVLAGVANAFLAVFTIRVGGSDTHVGLLSALPALISIFASLPGSRLVERKRNHCRSWLSPRFSIGWGIWQSRSCLSFF
jgi:cyanate permease